MVNKVRLAMKYFGSATKKASKKTTLNTLRNKAKCQLKAFPKEFSHRDITLAKDPMGFGYDIINKDKEIVGNVGISIEDPKLLLGYTSANVPKSWFRPDGKARKAICIDVLYMLGEQSKGYGRKVLQAINILSKKIGGEGRFYLDATTNSGAGFYSHVGLDISKDKKAIFDKIYQSCLKIAKENNLSKEEFAQLLETKGIPKQLNGKYVTQGFRYFEPTEQNLKLLYKK